VVFPPNPKGPIPKVFICCKSSFSRRAISGSGWGVFRGRSKAFLERRLAISKSPPKPRPTTNGGQGLGPARETVSKTNFLIPSQPAAGGSMAKPLIFSLPHPFGSRIISKLLPFRIVFSILSPFVWYFADIYNLQTAFLVSASIFFILTWIVLLLLIFSYNKKCDICVK